MYTDKSFESAKMAICKLVSFVLGSRPKWSSKGVFCISEWIVNLSTCSALSRLSRRIFPSSRFAFSKFFRDWIVLSANPVPVRRFAVPYLRVVLFSLQYLLNSFDMNALPLSVLIDFGTP